MYDGGGGAGWGIRLAVDISLLADDEILANFCASNFFKAAIPGKRVGCIIIVGANIDARLKHALTKRKRQKLQSTF